VPRPFKQKNLEERVLELSLLRLGPTDRQPGISQEPLRGASFPNGSGSDSSLTVRHSWQIESTAASQSLALSLQRISVMASSLTVGDCMTASPHTIGVDRTLGDAQRMMKKHNLHQLPVLSGGSLVGLLTEREVLLVVAMPHEKKNETRVEEAMAPSPLTSTPNTLLREAIEAMYKRKEGSSVVVTGSKVVGVLTTTDALRVLLHLLAEN
jgi:acetoin utilization protein AcuB